MFKTETHMHVSEVSRCAHLDAKEMARRYAEAGFSTLFITDHITSKYFARYGDIPWEDKVARHFAGYRALSGAAAEYGITVLPSVELQLDESTNHYLLYGKVGKLFERRDVFTLTAKELHEYAKACGVFVVQAHPLRDGRNVPMPLCVDALEAYNPNPRHDNREDDALAIARAFGLPVTSGSDAHRPEDVAKGGVESDVKIESAEDYVRLMTQGKLRFRK